jgi:hypothetical protein
MGAGRGGFDGNGDDRGKEGRLERRARIGRGHEPASRGLAGDTGTCVVAFTVQVPTSASDPSLADGSAVFATVVSGLQATVGDGTFGASLQRALSAGGAAALAASQVDRAASASAIDTASGYVVVASGGPTGTTKPTPQPAYIDKGPTTPTPGPPPSTPDVRAASSGTWLPIVIGLEVHQSALFCLPRAANVSATYFTS